MHYCYLKPEGTKAVKETDSQISLSSSSLSSSSSTGKDHGEALEKTKSNMERKKQLSQRATTKGETLRKVQDEKQICTPGFLESIPWASQHHNTVPRDQWTRTTHTTQPACTQKLTPPSPHTHPHMHNTRRKHARNTLQPLSPLLPTPASLLPPIPPH